MKTASAGLISHISGDALTMATLWRITRRDAQVFRFTDHNRDITYGGETYVAALGYRRAAISSGADLAVDETELDGLIDAASIKESDLRAGLWDGADVRIFQVNWADLTHGDIKILRGRLGEAITSDDGSFRTELRGMAQPLQTPIGSLYQPECRNDLGDARCGINLAFGGGWTQEATIATVTDSVTLVMSSGMSGFADGWFDGGVAIWQTGPNAGVAREVIAWTQGTLTLSLLGPPPVQPVAGATLRIQPGCDKRWGTCRNKFNLNQLKFWGEPLVPGANAILETPV
jgi:uncharacterized phage protein (TIGR02218 family)